MAPALNSDDFAERLRVRSVARKRAASQSHLPDERAAYRRAAALLTGFDPRTLVLPGEDGPAPGPATAILVEDAISIGPPDELRWRLRGRRCGFR